MKKYKNLIVKLKKSLMRLMSLEKKTLLKKIYNNLFVEFVKILFTIQQNANLAAHYIAKTVQKLPNASINVGTEYSNQSIGS